MTPRFFTVSEKGTVAPPKVMDSGRGTDMDIREDETAITSVFSSFSFNLLNVIQDLTSRMHSCIDCRRVSKL
jgi:hypothetical protein